MGSRAKTLANKNFHNIIVLHSSRTKQMRTYLPALHISKASTQTANQTITAQTGQVVKLNPWQHFLCCMQKIALSSYQIDLSWNFFVELRCVVKYYQMDRVPKKVVTNRSLTFVYKKLGLLISNGGKTTCFQFQHKSNCN